MVGGKVSDRYVEERYYLAVQDNSVHVYTISGDSLSEKKSFQSGKEIVKAEFSPDGATLAICSGRSVYLYDSSSYEVSRVLITL